MTVLRALAALLLFLTAGSVAAEGTVQPPSGSQIVASADSPSGTIHVDVTLNPEGRVGYMVSRLGRPVIDESRLGFLFTDAPEMLRNFGFTSQSKSSFDESWDEPWGEYRRIRDHHNELTVTFDEKNWLKRRMTIVFRLFDDGVGFRYEPTSLTSLQSSISPNPAQPGGTKRLSGTARNISIAGRRSRRSEPRRRRLRSGPKAGCTSRSTKPHWSTIRGWTFAGSTTACSRPI